MAAGEGRRLRPVTERYAKPVLPIDGRPVLATLLRELRAAGCAPVNVVTGHLGEQVETLVQDGAGFDLSVRFVRQPQPLGSADTVTRSLAVGARPPLLVCAADTVFAPGDVGRFADAFAGSRAAGAIAVRRDPPPSAARPAVGVEDGRVTRIPDHGGQSPLSGAPLWAIGPALVPILDGLPGPPFELSRLFRRAVDGGLVVRAIEIGKTRDLTDALDLVRENFPYVRAFS